MTDTLMKLEGATRMLAEARTLDEVLHVKDIAQAAAEYARAARLGLEAQNHAAEIKLRAERKAGELLKGLERSEGGKPTHAAYSSNAGQVSQYRAVLEETDTPRQTAARWQQIAKMPEPVFEEYVEKTKAAGEELTTTGALRVGATPFNNHAISDTPGYDGDEWYTPARYIDAARLVMGDIDLDPASCDEAQQVIQAPMYYTKQDDGLGKQWRGRVWLNPPYSMPGVKEFVLKLIDEYQAGHIDQAIVLTNNSSDTTWFHELLSRYPVCFTRGRISFWRPNHEAFGTRQGQVFFYLGDNTARFADHFSQFGIVVRRIDDN